MEKPFTTADQASRFEEYHAYFSEMLANRNPAKRYPSHRELGKIVGGISVSTVKRDIAVMKRRYKAPIEEIEEYGGWGYTEEVVKSPTVQMTQGQLVLICMAMKSLEGCRGTPGMDQAVEAFEKFLEALGPRLAARMRKIRDRVSFWTSTHFAPVDPEVFENIAQALIDDEELRFDYQKVADRQPVPAENDDQNNGSNQATPRTERKQSVVRPPVERRHVQPRHLVYYDGGWYLYTDDIPSGLERRKFMLSRMKSARGTGRHFEPKDKFDLQEEMRGMGIHNSGAEQTVRLRYSGKSAGLALERTYHGMQSITENRDGTVDLVLKSVIAPELKRFIRGSGREVEVLAPFELRAELGAETLEMAATWQAKRELGSAAKSGIPKVLAASP